MMRGERLMSESEFRVEKIREGTVIDHITGGTALAVLRILKISGREGLIVSVLMNVPSKKLGKKDIVKIEGRELNPAEIDGIALLAPKATVNLIRNSEVTKKENIQPPKEVHYILKCTNPGCITNTPEPIEAVFQLENEDPISLRCYYCSVVITNEDIVQQF